MGTLAGLLVAGSALWTAAAPEPLAIGAPAPDFALPGVDGKTYRLADFAEAPVLVMLFTCNHCPTAQAYEDRVQAFADEYEAKGVALVAVSPNDPLALRLDELGYSDVNDGFEDMVIRARDKSITYPYLYDGETQEMSRAYGPVSTPHAFVFDQDRKLRYRGRIDDSEKAADVKTQDLRNAVDEVLAGRPVRVETTATYGCSTKWSDKRDSVAESLKKWAEEEVALESVDLAGVEALLKNDTDKLRLINFWATWCGPCVAEFPDLVEINRMYRNRPFEMITVSTDNEDKASEVLGFLKKQEASMRNLHFTGASVYELIEGVGNGWEGSIPFTLIVAPGGEIIARHVGMIDPLTVKKEIVGHLGRTY